MLYIESPNPVPIDAPRPHIFVAGTITGSADWQKKVRDGLEGYECTVINPRRADFPMGDLEAGRIQVEWEFDKLWNYCDIFTMWMTKDTVGPICLYELGAALARHRVAVDTGDVYPFAAMIVGCDVEYERKFDVGVQSTLALGREAEPHHTLEEHIAYIQQAVEQFHEQWEAHAGDVDEDYDPEADEEDEQSENI